MKKELIAGNFSSIPLATLIASTLDVDKDDEVRDEGEEQTTLTGDGQ